MRRELPRGEAPAQAASYALKGYPPVFRDAAIEHHFRRADYDASRTTRVVCFIFGAFIALLSPFAAPKLLVNSPELVPTVLAGALMFQVPAFVFGAWLASSQRLRLGLAGDLQLALVLLIEVHSQLFRMLCHEHGTWFPSSAGFIGIGVAVLSFGLPLRRAGTALVVWLIAAKLAEFSFLKLNAQDYSAAAFDAIFVFTTLVGAYRADAARRDAYSRIVLSERRASVDALTGLSNRWGFAADAERIVRHAARERHPVTLAVVDVDRFKHVNDSAGHAYGDFVLTRVAQALGVHVRRPLDTCARVGGDEFVMLWHAPRDVFSSDIGNVVVQSVRELRLTVPDSGEPITVSVGVATLTPLLVSDLDRLMRLADRALYEAKQQGRDRCHTVRPGPHGRTVQGSRFDEA